MPDLIEDIENILQTRLSPPRLAHQIVQRTHLFKQLDASLKTVLTLVSAPAGSGKSTLVSSWWDHVSLDKAWLSLDEQDSSNLQHFSRYLAAALQNIDPTAGNRIMGLLRVPDHRTTTALQHTIINELNEIEQDYLLVLEDYHVIQNTAIHDLLIAILRHPPHSLHLLLISRTDPPLPVAALRASGQLIEIGADDMHFSADEVRDFLHLSGKSVLNEALIEQLHRRTEGWAAGLRLFIHMTHSEADISDRLDRDRWDNAHIYSYFADEVLSEIDPSLETFLLKTAILEAVCPSLGNVLAERPENDAEARRILNRLWEANLFTVSLNKPGEWYRYHTLFQEFLYRRLQDRYDSAAIDRLHQLAADWFEEKGLLDRAFHHALAITDPNVVAGFVGRNRYHLLNSEQWQRLENWLQQIPATLRDTRPDLLLTEALMDSNHSREEQCRAKLARVEILLRSRPDTPDTRMLWGEFYMLQSTMATYTGDGETMVRLAQKALTLLPDHWRFSVTGAHMLVGAGTRLSGQRQASYDYLFRQLAQTGVDQDVTRSMLLLTLIAILYWQDSNLTELQTTAQTLLTLGERHNRPEASAQASYFLGCAALQMNRLDEAVTYLQQALENFYLLRSFHYVQCVCAIARTRQILDQQDQAIAVLEDAMQFMLEMQNIKMLKLLRAFLIDLKLLHSSPSEVNQIVQKFDDRLIPLNYGFYDPNFTLLKMLLMLNTPQSRNRASTHLAQLAHITENTQNRRIAIKIHLYQTWLARLQDDKAGALTSLEQAIHLAITGNAIRPFVNLMPVIGDLLLVLQRQGIATTFINTVLEGAMQSGQVSVIPGVIESLSKRELEILTLLDQHLSNQEISQALFISTGTVKQHNHRIYRKLGVNTREEAVTLAKSLNLL